MTHAIRSAIRLQSLREYGMTPFQVGFDTPEGFHTAVLKADDQEHAQHLLRFLRLNGRLEGKTSDAEGSDPKDAVCFDVPTLIRVMELSRESIKTDEDLHKVVEALLNRSKEMGPSDPLTMDDYSQLFSSAES